MRATVTPSPVDERVEQLGERRGGRRRRARPTRPRSSSTTRPGARKRRFPGCRSACTKPCRKIIRQTQRMPASTTRWTSMPLRLEVFLADAVDELHGEDGVGARVRDADAGSSTSGSVAKFGRKRRCCRPRSSRWICSSTASQNARSAPSSDTSRSDGHARARALRPTKSRIERSSCTFSRMSGRRTLTATTSPVVAQHRAMHLRHRRGGDGLRLERRRRRPRAGRPSSASTVRAHRGEGERRHAIAQQRRAPRPAAAAAGRRASTRSARP